jgi:general secretion pathway protein G
MFRMLRTRSGLTLVELLIVVIILGVLAAVAIPQFSSSTDDARLATLDTTLSEFRNAIELYYHQHNNAYPGATKHTDGSATTTTAQADSAFSAQMNLYSSAAGVTSTTRTATYKYGPYLKNGLPKNPYNALATVKCDIATTDISSIASDGATGWKFYVNTGRIIANDGAHDSN